MDIIESLNKLLIWIYFYKGCWEKVKFRKPILFTPKNSLELIKIIGKCKPDEVVNRINKLNVKYESVIADSVLNVPSTNQLVLIVCSY